MAQWAARTRSCVGKIVTLRLSADDELEYIASMCVGQDSATSSGMMISSSRVNELVEGCASTWARAANMLKEQWVR